MRLCVSVHEPPTAQSIRRKRELSSKHHAARLGTFRKQIRHSGDGCERFESINSHQRESEEQAIDSPFEYTIGYRYVS